MKELVELVASWHSLVLAIVVFGFAPGFLLRLALVIYPRHHPRRKEAIADLYAMRRIERPFYVAEQMETALTEGLVARISHVRLRIRNRRIMRELGRRYARDPFVDVESIIQFNGPPGRGKSELMSRIIHEARERGHTIIITDSQWPRCDDTSDS